MRGVFFRIAPTLGGNDERYTPYAGRWVLAVMGNDEQHGRIKDQAEVLRTSGSSGDA